MLAVGIHRTRFPRKAAGCRAWRPCSDGRPSSPRRGAAARSHDREARKGGGRWRGREGFPRRGRRCLAATAVAGIFFKISVILGFCLQFFFHKFCSQILFRNSFQKFPSKVSKCFPKYFPLFFYESLLTNFLTEYIFSTNLCLSSFLTKFFV
jgi:hypothetical protein